MFGADLPDVGELVGGRCGLACLAHPAEIWGTIRSAGVLAGGVVVGAATFALYAVRQRLPLWPLADAIAPPLALAQGIGRLGCFAAGCCWGVPTRPDHPLAVTFTDPTAHAQTGVPLDSPRIATQPLEAGFDFALVAVLVLLGRREVRPAGTVFWVYVLVPILVSFVGEQLRLASAQTVLDARGLPDAQAVGTLSEDDQRSVVLQIVRREMGVMTLAAATMAFLLIRAATTAAGF